MTPHTPPGETRERVYGFVRERLLRGRPPTVREVQEAMGFRSAQSAQAHLQKLVAEGRLLRREGESRGYTLPKSAGIRPPVMVPLLGRVPAGPLSAAIEELDGYIPCEARSADGLFALHVHGDSMRDAAILNGDVVVVRAQSTASSGDIVVARVGDEATVKRLRLRHKRVELHPANPAFEVLIPPADEVTLLGKVIEVRRSLESRRP